MAPNKNSSNNTQNSKAWHSVRRASQSTQQPSLAIEDSVDLGAVCETPVTAKTPIREAFENIGNYSKSSTSQKKASSSSSQNARKQQQEEESRKDDGDGEMEFNFSDLEEDEDKSEKKQEEQFERSPVFYSSESDAPPTKNTKSKKTYQPTQEQASEKEEDEEKQAKQSSKSIVSGSSKQRASDYSQYFTPDEDENEKEKEGYSLRKTPTRVYQEKKKRKKMIKKKEILISSDEEEDGQTLRNDKMYDSDEIPDEDIEAMEEQERARKRKQPQTEEERREREKQEEERKKAELKLRKKKLTELSNSMRKKNQHKSIYIEEEDEISKDLFSSGKRKSTFDDDELFSQPSSKEEKEVFSSPKKRLKKKSGSPVGSTITFDKEDSDDANSEELENLAKEIRENNLLLSAKKKKKPLSLKTQKRKSHSSSEEEAPRRKSTSTRKGRDQDSEDEDDGMVTMSQFIVSDEEEDEAPEYNVYRMVDMMENDMDSQEFHSILTSNTRLSSDFKSSFAIYIHFITSHLLDEDFIQSLKFKDRTHFANASKMVEGKLETVKDSLIYSSAWKSRHKNLLQFYPIIKAREISLKDTEIDNSDKCCQACGRKNHQAEYTLIFKPPRATTKYEFSSGAHINWIDSPEEDSEEDNDFIQLSQRRAVTGKKCKYTKEKSFVGSTCYKRSLLYHSFQHYKFHLIQHIINKIDKIATNFEGEEEITSDYILDKIVSKKSWIESLYKKYLKLIEEAEASYTKSKDAGVIDVVDELFDVYDSEEEVINSDPEEKDNDFIVTNTRGGLRLKRTKPKSDDEQDQDDAELIDTTEEQIPPQKEKPKQPRELKLSFAVSPIPVEDDEEDKELDFLDKEEDIPKPLSPKENSKKTEEKIPDLSGYLDSSDDDILNYNF
ncbi:predicted protein [Naegleria gruberi]|uniref:Predicted protein n=1 Tax=Naegleria gruberi TaxID=5762 RepID=D2VWD9_NAEGR|nr:uncharacterized protein NAEGRDRAFT_59405 [Naegleria gruberi]EFC38819.1 predicted protein [Naegleria gruberi]|eukprot:XP_002671563.1 predicted protein [Naegleria gruberi strain NEG-M]